MATGNLVPLVPGFQMFPQAACVVSGRFGRFSRRFRRTQFAFRFVFVALALIHLKTFTHCRHGASLPALQPVSMNRALPQTRVGAVASACILTSASRVLKDNAGIGVDASLRNVKPKCEKKKPLPRVAVQRGEIGPRVTSFVTRKTQR